MDQKTRIALRWVLIDALLAMVAYTAVTATYRATNTLAPNTESPSFLFVVLIAPIACYLAGVYHQIWEQTSGHGIIILMQGAVIAVITSLLATTVFPMLASARGPSLAAVVLAFGGMTLVRYRSRLLSGLSWRWEAVWNRQFPADHTRILVIGAGQSGEMLARRVRYQHGLSSTGDDARRQTYQVIGFVDDDPAKQGLSVEGYRVLGKREAIPRLAETYDVDLIVVAIHNIRGSEFRDILTHCEQADAQVKIVPDTVGALGQTNGSGALRDVQPEDLIGRAQISRHDGVDLAPVTGRVVLITGAAGSIGAELSRQMATYSPKRLCLLDNNESALHDLGLELRAAHPDMTVHIFLADVTQAAQMEMIFHEIRPQLVYHAAAYKHVPMLERYPNEAVRVNISGTRTVAEQAGHYGAERFVLISTDKAVNPSSVMGASKRVCEYIVAAISAVCGYDTRYTVVRFGNVLGSRGSVVPTFTRQLDAGGPITLTDQRMTRYFMSIPEAVNLVIHAACLTTGDDVFVLRMGETVRIMDIAERMIRIRGLRPHIDVEIVEIGARPGEKLHEELYAADETPNDTEHPHIFRLKGQANTDWAAYFMTQLDRLTATDLATATDPLAEILRVTEQPEGITTEVELAG